MSKANQAGPYFYSHDLGSVAWWVHDGDDWIFSTSSKESAKAACARLSAQHAEIERLKAGLTDEQIINGFAACLAQAYENIKTRTFNEIGDASVAAAFRRGAYGEQEPKG